MMNSSYRLLNNQRGSVINVALLILVLIFLIGIGLHKISTTDIKIATNIKTATTTFYETEAGLEAVSELLEQNIACPTGFEDDDGDGLATEWEEIEGTYMVTNTKFWRNEQDDTGIPEGNPDPDSPAAIDDDIIAYMPADYEGDQEPDRPHTNFSVGGDTRFSTGSAIQMAAGYEGLGKGAGAGGANIIYNIFAMRYGEDGSEALHMIQWIHKLGLGGTCQY
jgi:hypothetical protein